MKPAILLEELNIDYDAHSMPSPTLQPYPLSSFDLFTPPHPQFPLVEVSLRGGQFESGFVDVNPNSKIPCAIDFDTPTGKPVKLFESGGSSSSPPLPFARKFS